MKYITINSDVAAAASAKLGEPVNKPRRRRYSLRPEDAALEPMGRRRREGEAIIAKVGGFLR